jgi:hypothetical protein
MIAISGIAMPHAQEPLASELLAQFRHIPRDAQHLLPR